jgi:tetratricopeptide (TPR) repeat protein
LTAQGKTNEALAEFKQALRLQPEYADAHYNLGQLYFAQGNADEAAHQYATAVQNRPDYAEAHYQLAALLASQRDFEEAIPHYRAAVRLKPDWLEALNNLAWILATQPDKNLRDGEGAVRLSVRAVELTKTNNAGALDTLAASYAEAGRFPEAIRTARQAVDTATASNQKELTAQLLARLALYESGRPFRE